MACAVSEVTGTTVTFTDAPGQVLDAVRLLAEIANDPFKSTFRLLEFHETLWITGTGLTVTLAEADAPPPVKLRVTRVAVLTVPIAVYCVEQVLPVSDAVPKLPFEAVKPQTIVPVGFETVAVIIWFVPAIMLAFGTVMLADGFGFDPPPPLLLLFPLLQPVENKRLAAPKISAARKLL